MDRTHDPSSPLHWTLSNSTRRGPVRPAMPSVYLSALKAGTHISRLLSFPISAQADQHQERNGWQKFIIANLTAGLRAAFIVGKWISNRQHRHRANCKPADCGAFHQRPSKSGGKCFSRSLKGRAKNRFPYLPKYCAQSVRVLRRLRGSEGGSRYCFRGNIAVALVN